MLKSYFGLLHSFCYVHPTCAYFSSSYYDFRIIFASSVHNATPTRQTESHDSRKLDAAFPFSWVSLAFVIRNNMYSTHVSHTSVRFFYRNEPAFHTPVAGIFIRWWRSSAVAVDRHRFYSSTEMTFLVRDTRDNKVLSLRSPSTTRLHR